MAKRKGHQDDAEQPADRDPADLEVAAADAVPAEGAASVEGDAPEGTPVYPPPVPDAAGERTANVPPAKQLPTAAPPSENPAASSTVPPAGTAIQAADAELARLRAENAAYRRRLGEDRPAGPVKTVKALVTVPGTAFQGVEVDVPADTPKEDFDRAATEAFQSKAGVWHLPAQAQVTRPEGDGK